MTILKGIRVVEGSAFVAVPLAGMTLAQMGAEVIRFDRIGGGLDANRWPVAPDGRSLFWEGLNKGKKSIAVNLKSEEGRELVTRIVTAPGDDAGLFLTNLRVRGWMDYETLSQERKDLVMVTLTGDRHGRPQVDYTVNPSLGIPHMTGPVDGAPVAHALPAWDIAAGNMVVSALLAAERHRLRTGQGQEVCFSLKDAAAATMGHLGMLAEAATTGESRPRAGNALYGAYGQDFVCADGQRVMVIGLTDRQWKGIVTATGTAEDMAALERETGANLRREGDRWMQRDRITAILTPWFAARPLAEVAQTFDKGGLTWAPFRSLPEALKADPDLGPDNPMFTMQSHPGLPSYPVPGTPMEFSAFDRVPAAPAPVLGEHSEEILAEVAGLDDGEIARLFDKGIVSQARSAHRSAA
ncbi:CoA transferase [Tropicibacter naphthalenivorans]|uniref:Formyl-coenzyme A transferase n=1 Tax=Tropicibacter naphthalenivorans TaxID=441103 RepID=A0A0P1GC62_9RHOB|nr:CoA transferase [Tropicibacter naphthalenivorans]CUH78895.1 Formyl-coenzyme A transferase [Tropicibacter naphthalenivorans]SMC82175.1 2-methylfumaryl-CoA isomerase [Tropicibacter naphthalenivorans]